MCRPASFVVTKARVFWSRDSDSHEKIIEEHHLHESGIFGPNIVRVELIPPWEDYTRPIREWLYYVEQDIRPRWYDFEVVESRVRAELPEWYSVHVLTSGKWCIRSACRIAFGNVKIEAQDDSEIYACAGATVNAYRDSGIRAYRGSEVHVYSGSAVRAHAGSTVYLHGGLCLASDGAAVFTVLANGKCIERFV